MSEYRQIKPITDDGWSDWEYPVMDGYKMACCDCGLVHNIDFRIVKYDPETDTETVIDDDNYAVKMRGQRNNRATGQLRRHNYKKAKE